MLRVVVAALVGLLVLAVPATAAPPDAKRLRALGIQVVWPATGALQGGDVLRVRVTSKRVRSRVALLRVDARGRVMRTVARRTLRSGTFRVRLPAAPGARYRLELVVRGKRYWSPIRTPAATPVPAPAPIPAPVPVANDTCEGGTPDLHVSASPSSGRPGDRVTFRTENRGTGCEWMPATHGSSWHRARAGGWEPVPVDECTGKLGAPDYPTCVGLPAFWPLKPGQVYVYYVVIPIDMPPGHYRVNGHEIDVLP